MDLQDFLTNDFIYNLAGGPLARISFAVFLLGTVIRTVKFMSLTRTVKQDHSVHGSRLKKKLSLKSFLKELPRHFNSLKHTVLAKSPVTIMVSLVFHVCLLFTPLFLLAHNIMISRFMGISFFSFSEQTTNIMTVIFHMVFFWLVDDTPEVKKTFLMELYQFVDQVDEIKKVHVGPPADTDRDVIDNTYSFNMVITFDSKKEHDIYQEHPAHKKFIENASSLWEKVLVYDSVKGN